MKGHIRQFAIGFTCFFRGLALLTSTPALWPYAFLPFMIGLSLFFGGFWWIAGRLSDWVQGLLQFVSSLEGAYFSILYWISLMIIWPAVVFALIYVIFVLSRLLAAPFHALLAERALIELEVIENRPFRFGEWLRLSIRMIVQSLLKTGAFAAVGLVLLLLSLIPLANILAAIGFLLIAAFDCTDYSLEAVHLTFRERIRLVRDNFAYFCGFAASLGLVFLIPGFNFFLLPAAVAGGSDLLGRIRKPG